MRFYGSAVPMNPATPEDRKEVQTVWDANFDPHYGEEVKGQAVDSQHSFAQMRDDMNTRRRQTARRMEGC